MVGEGGLRRGGGDNVTPCYGYHKSDQFDGETKETRV